MLSYETMVKYFEKTHAVNELTLYIDNDSRLYHKKLSLFKEFKQWKVNGSFLRNIALVNLRNFAMQGAAEYLVKFFDTTDIDLRADLCKDDTIDKAANEFLREFEVEYALGNFDTL